MKNMLYSVLWFCRRQQIKNEQDNKRNGVGPQDASEEGAEKKKSGWLKNVLLDKNSIVDAAFEV